MPSTTSTVVSLPRPSSTVITPSLPTFVNASASTLPIVGSLLPAIVAICCSCFLSFTSTGSACLSIASLTACDGLADAAAQRHRIGAGGDHLEPFAEDALGQHGGGRRAVAGDVVRLAGRFLHELGAQVLERVIELDVLGDGHAVLGDLGRAPALVEHRVAAAGAERAAHGPGQLLDARRQRRPGLVLKHHLFCCHAKILQLRWDTIREGVSRPRKIPTLGDCAVPNWQAERQTQQYDATAVPRPAPTAANIWLETS